MINRVVLWAGPAVPAIFTTLFSLASGAADSSPEAKALVGTMASTAASAITMPWVWLGTFLAIGSWGVAFLITDRKANQIEEENAAREGLAKRMSEAAEGVTRLIVLYRSQSAYDHLLDTDLSIQRHFSASANLLIGFQALYAIHVSALLEEAQAKGIEVDSLLKTYVEHPTNPFGVEAVARGLGVLADRIRRDW